MRLQVVPFITPLKKDVVIVVIRVTVVVAVFFEVMPITPAMRHLINENGNAAVLREAAEQEGMFSLREDGYRLVAQGLTSVAEVLRITGVK